MDGLQELKAVMDTVLKLLGEQGYALSTLKTHQDVYSRLLKFIDTVTACALVANIGDINRFPNPDKLARFAGIAPVKFSSAGKGKEQKSRQGNRELHGIFYFLAVQQVQTSKGSRIPRNPVFFEYYQRKIKEGKTKVQALVCVMRRLVNIIYGMMKNKTEYIMPQIPEMELPLKEAV